MTLLWSDQGKRDDQRDYSGVIAFWCALGMLCAFMLGGVVLRTDDQATLCHAFNVAPDSLPLHVRHRTRP